MSPSAPINKHDSPALGLGGSTLIFGAMALVAFGVTSSLEPLARLTGLEPIIVWFIVGGVGMFVPLIGLGVFMLLREARTSEKPFVWRERLRMTPMRGADWIWTLAGLLAIGVAMGVMLLLMKLLTGTIDLTPSFMELEPLGPGRWWILVAWIPFYLVNILGEEFLWRGVILPRQEAALGRWAWMVNGAGWLMFHGAFGMTIMIMLIPTVFILPYVVQRRGNSWIGVVIHAALNGPGFLAVSFGLV